MVGEIGKIIEALKKYEKVTEIISGEQDINTKAMCNVLNPFQHLSINEFEKLLKDNLINKCPDKISSSKRDKEDIFNIAKLIVTTQPPS